MNKKIIAVLCILIASVTMVQGCIHEKINPDYKKNFYQAVNKNWIEHHHVSDEKSSINNFTDIQDKIDKELKQIVINLQKSKSLTAEEKIILDVYSSYTNVKLRDKKGISVLKEDIDNINSAKTHKDIMHLFAKFQKISVASPLSINPEFDAKDPQKHMIYIDQHGIQLLKEYYEMKDEKAKKEVELIQNLYKELFQVAQFDDADKKAQTVIDVETKLAKIYWSKVKTRDMSIAYYKLNFEDTNKLMSNLYLEDTLDILGYPKKLNFSIDQLSYIEDFNKLFKTIPVDDWKDYLKVKLLIHFGGYLSSDFTDVFLQYSIKKGLVKKDLSLDKKAISFISANVPMLLSKIYVKNYFSVKSKQKVTILIKNILNEYKIAITNTKRLSPATKEKALEKVRKMKFDIGYPDKWDDYSGIKSKDDDMIYNLKQISAFNHNQSLDKLSKPKDKNKWAGHAPHVVNASYAPWLNRFVILAGILKEPFFSLNAPDVDMYATIGFVIAHEIGHGFDDQGSAFDGDGKLKNWWTKDDFKKFDVLKNKLIDQANRYEILPGKFENGNLEVGEIIADLSGAEMALSAYLKIALKNNIPRNKALKMFFTKLAHTWRGIYKEQYAKMVIDLDPHPLGEYRINGTLQNMELFYEVFDIKKGDKMYLDPEKRVKVW